MSRRISRSDTRPTRSSGIRRSPARRSTTTTCSPVTPTARATGPAWCGPSSPGGPTTGPTSKWPAAPSSSSAGTTASTARTRSTAAPWSAARSRPGENTQVVTRLQYLHAHEDRGTSDSINTAFTRPLQYDQFEGAGAINQRYGRFWTSIGAAARLRAFRHRHVAGIPVSQDYRNGAIASIPVRVGYVVAPLTSVFVEVAGQPAQLPRRCVRLDTASASSAARCSSPAPARASRARSSAAT